MSHWIYPANIKMYDVITAFSDDKSVWPINSNVEVGDTLYLYLSAPVQMIRYVCEVMDVHVSESLIKKYTQSYLKGGAQNSKDINKAFMLLSNIRCVSSDKHSALSYENLKTNGLNGMLMGPRKLENNPILLNYIKEHIDAV